MQRKMCDWETKMDSIIRHVENNAIELAKSLENKRNLLVLDLTNNKIMSDGCVAVCKAIQ